MRRFGTLIAVVAVAFAMALPAGAGKPDNPGKPDGPGPEHPDGMTCEELYGEEYAWDHFAEPDWNEDRSGFTIKLTPAIDSTCIDLDVEAAHWKVEATIHSALNYIFSIKDSLPGDFCYFYPRGSDTSVDVGSMPGAFIDACGLEYSDSDPMLVFQASAKLKKGGEVVLDVTLAPLP